MAHLVKSSVVALHSAVSSVSLCWCCVGRMTQCVCETKPLDFCGLLFKQVQVFYQFQNWPVRGAMFLSEDMIKLWSPSWTRSEQNPLYYEGRGEDRPVILSSSWQLTCSHIQQRAQGCHCGVADHSEMSMWQNALHILTWKPAEKLFRVFLSNTWRQT